MSSQIGRIIETPAEAWIANLDVPQALAKRPAQSEVVVGKPPGWPTALDQRAYYGIAGEIVRAIEPHTEADPAGLLVQLLVGFGNLVGRGPFCEADGAEHRANLYVVLVGESSRGRKGTAWAWVGKRILGRVDESWLKRCHLSGLSTGEGLINQIRDATRKSVEGENGEMREAIMDGGVEDKRLMVTETEFAGALATMKRDSNTLSATLRAAWDGETLKNAAKNAYVEASDPHVSMIGHITQSELTTRLPDVETKNGFSNRVLWVAVTRSKLLPDGGSPDAALIDSLVTRLGSIIYECERIRRITRDREAKALWCSVYPQLTAGRPGTPLVDQITSRAEAQVLRLSMLYALLDESATIRKEHLEAALAVWDYCERSVRYVFGGLSGDKLADRILAVLKEAGGVWVSRTELSASLGRNVSSQRIAAGLESLREGGFAESQTRTKGTTRIEEWRVG